ncbi:hypothetical protein EXIGLDRAFT_781922 [Exidia glandulosa HHB12029]|uniref:Uncharacterized protein n=1 Tax=Exidia glandulosa HHB12029 TaxID=1314781 RepID=A0A165B2V9_EXIGL|nr:hypothetical protein EXIGLDRAFT_781922 [Exidia glandulosa HHB12029]
MRTDFREERKWKVALAHDLALACKAWYDASPEDRPSHCSKWSRLLEPEPADGDDDDDFEMDEAVDDASTLPDGSLQRTEPLTRLDAAAISALFAPPPPKSPGPLAADDPASPRRRLLQPPPTQTDAMAVDLDFDAAHQPGPPPPPSVLVPESAFTRRLPIPPLSSLPPTFNHTIKPTKLQRGEEGGHDWRRGQASCT